MPVSSTLDESCSSQELAALLSTVDDVVIMAELAAEALAGTSGSSLVALVLGDPDSRVVVGREDGIPLTASRQRAMSAALDTGGVDEVGCSVHAVPGRSEAVVLLDADAEPVHATPSAAVLAVLGASLDRADAQRSVDVLNSTLARETARAEDAAAARDLLLSCVEHLLQDRPAEVDALLTARRQASDAADDPVLAQLTDAARTLRPRRLEPAGTGVLLTLALLFGSHEAAGELTRWAARMGGLDLSRPLRAVVVSRGQAGVRGAVPVGGSAADELFARRVRGELTSAGAPPLLAVVDGAVVAVQADEPMASLHARWRAIADGLSSHSDRVRVSMGGAGTWPSGLRSSLQQARWLSSLQRAGSLSDLPDVAVFEHAGLIGEVVGLTRGQDLLGFARRVLEPLLDDDRCGGELLETLHAYLASAGSTGRAAEALHLHPSSVKYRLKVIRQLIGRERLEDADARFELELAVRLLVASRQLDPADGLVAA